MRCAVHTLRRLQQTAVSCKRSDYNEKTSGKVSLQSSFVKKPHNGSFYMPLFHELRCDRLFMSSTRNRSTTTKMSWMKKTTDAISGIARKESVRVALLQTHGEDGAILLMLPLKSERSFIGAFRPDLLRKIHQFFLYLKFSSCDMRLVKSFGAPLSI